MIFELRSHLEALFIVGIETLLPIPLDSILATVLSILDSVLGFIEKAGFHIVWVLEAQYLTRIE